MIASIFGPWSTPAGRSHLPWTDHRIHVIGADFLVPYWTPFASFVSQPEDANFLLALNDYSPGAVKRLADARRYRKPLAWWTIEDPNGFEQFLPQAAFADIVFTTDEECIPRYCERLGHDRVHWLPLAASPHFHYPLPLSGNATDFVLSANWYENEARLWAVKTVVEPLRVDGRSLTLYSYESHPWPETYHVFWKGETYYRTVAEQYRHGRVVLGLNNQRSGMDGRGRTVMTSMRTFEALACGKPLLSAHSDAYEALGFINGTHMVWVDSQEEAREWAPRLLGDEGAAIAQAGREFVLHHHTYGHRLAKIGQLMTGQTFRG